MSALFDFRSFLTVLLLSICTCAYVNDNERGRLSAHRTGFRGLLWKLARIGERLSPWVGAGCFLMGCSILFY